MKKIIFAIAILISLTSFGQQRVEMKRDSGVTHVTPYVLKDSLAAVRAKIKADSNALRAAMGGGGGSQNLQQVTDLDSVTTHKVTVANLNISGIPIYVNQDSAVAHGLVNGDVYYTGFVNGAWQTAVVAPFPDHWELLVHYTSPGTNSVSLASSNIINISVYWGDGQNNIYTSGGSISHTYADSGLYTVKIFGSLGGGNNNISASGFGAALISTSAINGITGFNYGYQLFNGCTSLTSILTDLFKYCPAITSFNQTFASCTSLPSIPDSLFYHNTVATDFSYTFATCSSLLSIPSGLFSNNTAATTFTQTFGQCTSLPTIPDSLFYWNTAATTFSYTFYSCTSLTAIPLILFDNNTLASDFYNCFYGDAALLGNAPPLWVTYSSAYGSACFNGDTGLTNYAAIDSGWK
jgi:hypothetical protein